MTPGRRRKSLSERLRAIIGRPEPPPAPRTRVSIASFEHSHRVWTPDPSRSWFEKQGIEPAEPKRRWWK